MVRNTLVLVLVAAIAAGCASTPTPAPKTPAPTATQARKDIDFTALHTYAWMPDLIRESDTSSVNPQQLDILLRDAVDEQMDFLGYRLTSPGTADFLVGYHAAVSGPLSRSQMNRRFDYPTGRKWDEWTKNEGNWTVDMPLSDTRYEAGTLAIDVVDTQTRALLWRGATQARINTAATAETRATLVKQAVHEILLHFPAK